MYTVHLTYPPQSSPPSCLSSEAHSEANSEQDPWLAPGAPNRNETVSPPSSQVSGDPTGPETSCSSAETTVSEKPECAGPLQLCQGPTWKTVCTMDPTPKGSQSSLCECSGGYFIWRRGKLGFRPGCILDPDLQKAVTEPAWHMWP